MPVPSGAPGLRAVVFDVGETLVDETAEYGAWADWLGVPRHTFSAVFGAVVARGGHHREAFQRFRPGFQLVAYAGDRLDNDVLPALAAGMVAVFLERGPWGHLHAAHPDAARAHLRVASLEELADRLAAGGVR
jgi:FMN phosphatase YigB (HAD superfamily)